MMRNLLLLILFNISWSQVCSAQNISINEDGSAPDATSILDIKSTTKGVLVPRMNSSQRVAINPAAIGLLVFDTTTETFWFRQSLGWVELVSGNDNLADGDLDTKVQVEESEDEDKIRFDIGGEEGMVLRENSAGATVLDFGSDLGLIIGHQAGENSISGLNTFLGYRAGRSNTTGNRNVVIGYLAAQNSTSASRNIILGYEAGKNNEALGSTFIGYQSGKQNTSGISNSFLGYESGLKNIDGYRNTFLGFGSGKNTTSGFQNTFLGFNSGLFNTIGENNVFLGHHAGSGNRTGNKNTIIGFNAGANPLTSIDIGNGNTVIGNEAGYRFNDANDNVLIGNRSGYEITSGKYNVLVGSESGFFMNDDSLNVAIGYNSQRENNFGSSNISIGDSSLLKSDGNANIALGSNAGDDNLSGNNNIFLGTFSGRGNTGESGNIFIGNNTSVNNQTNAEGSIAIGNNVEIATSNSIIIGDPNNQNLRTGIGLNNPTAKVHIFSDLPGLLPLLKIWSYAGPSFTAFPNQGVTIGNQIIPPSQGMLIQGKSILRDSVVINRDTPANGYILSVNGDIACEEVRIQNDVAWPDFVFEEEYRLIPLLELETILQSQKHLPGIPSAKEVNKDGILMNEITAGLLEKIEELYLYIIELKKEINALKE